MERREEAAGWMDGWMVVVGVEAGICAKIG